jgi:hypothetical protein
MIVVKMELIQHKKGNNWERIKGKVVSMRKEEFRLGMEELLKEKLSFATCPM